MRLFFTIVASAVSLICVAGAGAEQAPVNLCTAAADGNYFAAGRDIASHASAKFLRVSVLETAGSMDNMRRLARGECGAAIVQSDAFLVHQGRDTPEPVEITRNRFLFAEFAHLVCRRDARLATTDDLLSRPERHRVMVGARDSGSALTWQAFTLLDGRYGKLQTERVGGEDALGGVLDGEAHCLFFVSGMGSVFARQVDQRGEELRILAISDDKLRSAQSGSVTPYETRRIPPGVYANLQKGGPDAGTETVGVSAMLVVSRAWTDRHPDGPSALLGAVTGAMPAISRRATAGLK